MTARALKLVVVAVGPPNQTVLIRDGESIETGVTILETSGRPISGATVTIGLGTAHEPPNVFATPDLDRSGLTPDIRTVHLLVGSTTPTGRWHRWIKIALGDEIRLLRAPGVVTIR